MVIYVWQCMAVLLYDCICARWLWSIMNAHAIGYNYTFLCATLLNWESDPVCTRVRHAWTRKLYRCKQRKH